MGPSGRSSSKEREVLHVLQRTLSGHYLQHNDAAKDALPHRKPHHPVRRHYLPYRPRLLFTVGQRREDLPLHLHPPLADRVLPAPGRDHSPDVLGRSPHREVPPIHDDPRHAVDNRDGNRPERSLPVSCDPRHVALGAQGLPRHPASAVGDASPEHRQGPRPQGVGGGQNLQRHRGPGSLRR